MTDGLPEGVTLTKMLPEQSVDIENRLYDAEELEGITFTKLDAPNNTVFDEANSRVLSLPQTLNETETDFVIKRDADEVKDFFAMEEVGGFKALGTGVASFFAAQPQAFGGLVKEQAELTQRRGEGFRDAYDIVNLGALGNGIKIARVIRDATVNFFGAEEAVKKADALIERNKKYMADAGLERPEEGGLSGVMYDIGQGGSSLLASLGIAGLTRSPSSSAIYFGALQKSAVYQEARAAGLAPEEAADISTLAGVVEGALEFVGIDRFMKALKGNKAVSRFINGFAIEAIQEGSQAAGEEAITQISGIRDKAADETIKDILYQAALGGVIGGGANVALGSAAKQDAIESGLDEKTATEIGAYVEKNVDSAKENMTEFIDKELAPIAADDKSAQEFISLMQKFSNDVDLVDRDSLDPETQKVFDEYVKMFNESTVDVVGIAEVEKTFFEQAIAAGVERDQAVAASKLISARADAASRALGITPQEWLDIKNIVVDVVPPTGEAKPPEVVEVNLEQAEQIKQDLIRRAEGFTGDLETDIDLFKDIGVSKEMSGQEIVDAIKKHIDEQKELELLRPKKIKPVKVPTKLKKAKGQVTFKEGETLIELFEEADPSTLFHELGHIFLRDMRDAAKLTNRPRVKADYQAIKKWLNITDPSKPFTIKQEEKFARGFEAYLREGKAPKPELQSVFDRFKEWLTSVYKSVQDLNVSITPEIREVFDRMLGADFAISETLMQERAARNIEEDYAAVAALKPATTFLPDTGTVFRSASDLVNDALTPVATRLGKIDIKLKHAVRRFVFNTGLYTHEDRVEVKPFIETVGNKFTPEDYRVFDLALKNRDTVKVDFLVDKYGIQKEWGNVRDVLDNLFNEAQDVGMGINYIEEYFPRKVKRDKANEYMAAMRGHDAWSDIEMALKEADPDRKFTAEEQAAFVNSYLRGFSTSRIQLTRPSFIKERTVDYITPEFNVFYQDSMPTLLEYIGALRHGIEARKLFGKSEKETDQNIGAYVLDLINEGVIDVSQEQELKEIFKAIVEPTGTHGFISWTKNAGYVYLMGSPISAITQIGDLAFALHKNGYFRTIKSLTKSLTGRQLLKKEDIGIDNILQEFEDETRASKAVRQIFKAIGLEWMDNIGKETLIDGAYNRLRAEARKNKKDFNDQLEVAFGDEATQVRKDLVDGTMSEDVKYLLFAELSDVQPISLAEMPISYLRGGNWRVLYMLKTYTMKQLDIYRREIFSNLASGDVKLIAKGMKNLISLGAALMLMGMSSDALKDLLLGRELDISDLVHDNILKLFGITKYQIYKSRTEGIGNTIFRFMTPPILSPIDDLRDLPKMASGEKSLKDAEILQRFPVIGKFYYWWWGAGKGKKQRKKRKGKSKVSTP